MSTVDMKGADAPSPLALLLPGGALTPIPSPACADEGNIVRAFGAKCGLSP